MSARKLRWSSIKPRVGSAKALLLLLDYDGTLVPIANHPSRAVLPPKMRRLLERLARQRGVRLVLISGRSLPDLKRMVGLRNLCYVGNHGLELQGGRLRYVHPMAQRSRTVLKRLARKLTAALRQIHGAWVEDKGLTISVHWRLVPRSAYRRFHDTVRQLTMPSVQRRAIQLGRGKRVVEMYPPVQWGKGDIVDWLRQRVVARQPRLRPLLIYLGDDRTDESGFRAVNRCQGISVFVGARPHATSARWWVKTPQDVHKVLARILEEQVVGWKSKHT